MLSNRIYLKQIKNVDADFKWHIYMYNYDVASFSGLALG